MRSPQAQAAARLAQRFALPWPINYLHVAQVENLLSRLQLEGNAAQKRAGTGIAALWRARLAEGVFAIDNPTWDDAWRIAIGFHRDLITPIPQPSHLLHLAAAQLSGATHFVSLHPPSRQFATKLGLVVVPQNI